MKVSTIGLPGQIGKSTIAHEVLSPRINGGAKVISIESINSSGKEKMTLRGEEFAELYEALLRIKDAVVDIGSSNVEALLDLMEDYAGSHEEIDFFVVPVIASQSQIDQVLATVELLNGLGVPPGKIKIVFNMLGKHESVERKFAQVLDYAKTTGKCVADPDAVMHKNDIYGLLVSHKKSIQDIIKDKTDWKKKLLDSKKDNDQLIASDHFAMQRLAPGVVRQHDQLFKTLFGEVKEPCQQG